MKKIHINADVERVSKLNYRSFKGDVELICDPNTRIGFNKELRKYEQKTSLDRYRVYLVAVCSRSLSSN